jgi:glyoxylase-like metal-dependent hydrolase (beta-lactamase superfamily II)
MEIIPGVHAITSLGTGRAYLYQEADRLTLIDTGLPGSPARVFAAIERLGRRPEDLRQIVITHHHRDHAGALADVVERTGAQVLAHALEAPVVRGDQPPPDVTRHGVWRIVGAPLGRSARAPQPARVDRELQDGDEIDLDGGARILHVPGHTAGSIAVYVPGRKLLFTGDAAIHAPWLSPPRHFFGLFNEDRAQSSVSFARLAELEFDVACFGHGKPLGREASSAFRKAAGR